MSGMQRGYHAGRAAIMQERQVVAVEDLTLMNRIEESEIVSVLNTRLRAKKIYTYIGPVLITVNPFQWLPLYDRDQIELYRIGARTELEPHIFAVAESAFRTMLLEEEKQCIIISGESGAGKTEAAKQIMNYIAAVSGSGGDDHAVQQIKSIILDSNPAMEAFGNAMTLRNNNSSRFGKYFEVRFSLAGNGTPLGGHVSNYLLEKSRAVRPGPGERTFHIFYQLLAGAPSNLLHSLNLTRDPRAYRILSMSKVYEIRNEGGHTDDAEEFSDTISSLETLGIDNRLQNDFFRLLAAILHLGNLEFSPANIKDAEGSVLNASDALHFAADAMHVDPGVLTYALTYTTLSTMAPGGKVETYQVPLSPVQAQAARDALAKDIYSRMFDLLVSKVNSGLEKSKQSTRLSISRSSRNLSAGDDYSIGVLDIYGFEIFDDNRFEQFCINYVNEKLQQIFIELTLRSEQEDYANEGIKWTPIPFFDNKIVCDLIEGKRPAGVFSILDDTTKITARMGSADDKFRDKLNNFHSSHPHYAKFARGFTITHYAGPVSYNVDGFIEANKDILSQDLQHLVKSSSDNFLRDLYPEEVNVDERRMPTTAGFKIRSQCGDLVYTLLDCNPHYVRCIKSNDQKKAGGFDSSRVTHQTRYLGLLENVKVRRAGFALRIEFINFTTKFRVLAGSYVDNRVFVSGTDAQIAKAILEGATRVVPSLKKPGEAQLGKTKVFIKSPETYHEMQEVRKKLVGEKASKIQAAWRRYAGRRKFADFRVEMSHLWERVGKESTAADLVHLYDAFYVKEPILTHVLRLLESYQLGGECVERLQYTDEVFKLNSSGKYEKTVFFLTDQAIYTCSWALNRPDKSSKGSPPPEFALKLLRRTKMDQIEGVLLSQLADDFICIKVRPQEKIKPDTSKWVDKGKVKRCMETNQKFGFLRKSKHRCHKTGRIYVKECTVSMPLPDYGYYDPVTVHKSVVGNVSIEMQEDMVFVTEKKAELACMIHKLTKGKTSNQPALAPRTVARKAVGNQARTLYEFVGRNDDELTIFVGDVLNILDSSNSDWWTAELKGKRGYVPANYVKMVDRDSKAVDTSAILNDYQRTISFANKWEIRSASSKSLSNTPKGLVEFRLDPNQSESKQVIKSGLVTVIVPSGIATYVIQRIRANQAERRRLKDIENEKYSEARRANASRRADERRRLRDLRIAEKKERRQAEKAKRDKEREVQNFSKAHAIGGASYATRLAQQGAPKSGGNHFQNVAASAPTWVTERNTPSNSVPSRTAQRTMPQAKTYNSSNRPIPNGRSLPSEPTTSATANRSKLVQPLNDAIQGNMRKVNPNQNFASRSDAPVRLPARPTRLPAQEPRSAAVVWEAYRDDNSGSLYYYNPTSGESIWQKPTGNVQINYKTHL